MSPSGKVEEFSGRGAARAEDAQGTPTQSHISPSVLVYEEKRRVTLRRVGQLGPDLRSQQNLNPKPQTQKVADEAPVVPRRGLKTVDGEVNTPHPRKRVALKRTVSELRTLYYTNLCQIYQSNGPVSPVEAPRRCVKTADGEIIKKTKP